MRELKNNEIEIKTSYVSLNPVDKLVLLNKFRIFYKYKKPVILGSEGSGIVTKIGSSVKGYKVGDRVMFMLPINELGALKPYHIINEDYIAKIPSNISLIEASTIPLNAVTAFQAAKLLKLKKDSTLIINGISGGFGDVATIIIKYFFGAQIIGIGNEAKKKRLEHFGVDQYYNYKNLEPSELKATADMLIDCVGKKQFLNELLMLKQNGKLLSLNMGPNKEFSKHENFNKIKNIMFSLYGKKFDKIANKQNKKYFFMLVKNEPFLLQKITDALLDINFGYKFEYELFDYNQLNIVIHRLKNNVNGNKMIIKFDEN